LEPGDRPIYLVVSSKTPTIWRFSGSVGRLSHIAVFGPVGIAGVPEAKIAFHEGDCVAMFGQKPTLRARIALSLGLGHVVDVIAGQNSLSSVQLPSGEVASEVGIIARGIPPTADSELLLRALRYNPGGVASIDAGSVLSRGDVEPYDVLPQHWGLIELVAKGSLKRTDPHSREDSFTILKPMRFPGGLDRSPALTFYLPEGVPMPEGDPGQSKVLPLPDTSNDA
jgi:hypothetical protein